jgi:TolA-binding protein
MRSLVWLALAIGLASGCGPSYGEAFVRSFSAARRAYSAGRYAEAETLFADAAQDAQRVKDRDEANFMRARSNEKLERWPNAQQAYRTIVATSGPRAPRAAFQLARLQIAHGDEEAGYQALAEAIARYPENGAARRALTHWTKHAADTKGEAAAREQLGRWRIQLSRSTLLQQVIYEEAHSHWRSGDLKAAHDRFLAAVKSQPYPHGTLSDDAWWHASHVAEAMNDPRLAVADLEALLATREDSDIGGSYERPRYPAAQLRIGTLYRDRLGDPAAAREAFRKTHQRHQKAIIADDAAWSEAVIVWQSGDRDESCDLAKQLQERFPDSRYRRCLDRLCSTMPPPDGRPCPDYILRTLDGESS